MTWDHAVYPSTPYMLAAGELLESNLIQFQRSAKIALQKGYSFPNITESCIWSSTLAPDDSTYNGNAWALEGNILVIKPKRATCAALPLKEF